MKVQFWCYHTMLLIAAVVTATRLWVSRSESLPNLYHATSPIVYFGGSSSDLPSQFLPLEYSVKDSPSSLKFKVRQVPGDGGCLFHSIAVSIAFRRDKSHPDCFDGKLRALSRRLRELSIDVLKRQPGVSLVMEGEERISSQELLEMVANNYNMSSTEYLIKMADAATWGGGPEIVALSNHFKRPIHVYELDTCGALWRKHFQLRICAKFGSPEFDAKCPLYLLCADGRFPHLCPGTQKEVGDHFLALFPAVPTPVTQGPRRVRGGSSSSSSSNDIDSSKSSSSDQDINDRRRGRRMGVGLGFAPLRGIKGLVGSIMPGRRKTDHNMRSSSASGSNSYSDEIETEEDKSRSHASPLPHNSQSQSPLPQLSQQSADYAVGALPGVTYPEDNDEFEGLT